MGLRGFVRFAAGRLVAFIVLAVGVTLIAFIVTNLVPGDPVAAALPDLALDDPEIVDAYREKYGLDKPLPVQYLVYLGNVARGDLGTSIVGGQPVATLLGQSVPATLELAFLAVLLSAIVGVAFGTVAAFFRDRLPDQVLRVISLIGVSMPVFWLALVAFYFLSFRFGIFPGIGRLTPGTPLPPRVTGMVTIDSLLAGDIETFRDAFGHLLLPALVLAAYTVSLLTRFTRSAVLEVLNEDFVRTARAKGLRGVTIVVRHVLRAALAPIITVAGVLFGSILSGTVLVETIFSWPGIGQYAFRSATNLDLPSIMGVSLFVAIVYITINFIVDVLYSVIDPRVRLR
ncbi:MAG: ABC transporter permease [Actinobacteria bacterium]|nr:ABC transporter permease [Actinomycetota bacterium]NIU20899.1 ABC transporter permease [Actinomycetota bacterium]